MKNDILQWLSGLLDFFQFRLAKSNRSGGGGPGDKRVAGVREEGEESAGGGSSKKSGKQGGKQGGVGRNYATILNISQTTRAKSRLRQEAKKKVWGRGKFRYGRGRPIVNIGIRAKPVKFKVANPETKLLKVSVLFLQPIPYHVIDSLQSCMSIT